MKTNLLYPHAPKLDSYSFLEPSKEFKAEVLRTIWSIIFFIAAYLFLVLMSFVLALLFGGLGIGLISYLRNAIGFMLGLGAIGLGLMVIFYMIKFVFSRHKVDRSGLLEIDSQDQPELISFVSNIVSETGTSFPKRIYLSSDVNAAVFYDSSFLSMFFPIEKNLQIGLGLVNSVTVSELKAILAHEFGHFSQRSMALGNYVYNVNKIIYNLLYDNEGYNSLLTKWGNMSGYFSLFAKLTAKIVEGIQQILHSVYETVNKTYMGLSRQMEFHADAVAASVAGSQPLITSLRRLEASDICYNKLFQHYNSWVEQSVKPDNIYPQHSAVMEYFGDHFKIPSEKGFLQLQPDSLAYFNRGRVNIKNQWASHPSTDDREKHLQELNIASEIISEPAWVLFRNTEELQRQITEKVYTGTQFPQTPHLLDIDGFKKKFSDEIKDAMFHPAYKGYYDARDLTEFNAVEIAAQPFESGNNSFEELFNDEYSNLPTVIEGIKSDTEILENIKNENIDVRSFDFAGIKYSSGQTIKVLQQLRTELQTAETKLLEHDKRIFQCFYEKAVVQQQGETVINSYNSAVSAQKEKNKDFSLYRNLLNEMNPIYVGAMPVDEVVLLFKRVRQHEVEIKARIKRMVEEKTYLKYSTNEETIILEEYCSKDHNYFAANGFNDEALKLMNNAVGTFIKISAERCFRLKKGLLELQVQFLSQ